MYKSFLLFTVLFLHSASAWAEDEKLVDFIARYGQSGQFVVFRECFQFFEAPKNFTNLKDLVKDSLAVSRDSETMSAEDQFAKYLGKPKNEFGALLAWIVEGQKLGELLYQALDLQDFKDHKFPMVPVTRLEKYLKAISQSLANCTETEGQEISFEMVDLRSLSFDPNKRTTLSFAGCKKSSETIEIMVNGVPSPDTFGSVSLGKVPLGMVEWDVFQVSSDRKTIERLQSRLIDKGEATDSLLELSSYQ